MFEALVGLGIAAVMLVFAYVVYTTWSERRKSRDFYLDTVIAYQVGLIIQKADEKKIKLIYPDQKDKFIDSIENGVKADLNRP